MANYNQTEYIDKSNYYRGLIINTFGLLEIEIELHIFNHFRNDNKVHFYNILLNRLNFALKKEILKSIINSHEVNRGFVKTNNNGYPNKELFCEIRDCAEQRNYFAHYVLLPGIGKPDKVIGLASFRDGLTEFWYTEEKINDWTYKIRKCTMELRELMSKFTNPGVAD